MQKKMKNYVTAAGITVVMAAVVISRFMTSYGDVSGEKESLSQMQNQKSDIEQILKDLEAKKSSSEIYLAELDAKVSEIANNIYSLQLQIDAKNQEIAATQDIITKTEGEISEQYAAMKLRIQYLYENGNASFMSMILDSKSIGDFLNRAEYISQLTSYDREMLEELQVKKSENEAAKASLNTQLTDLQVLQENAEAERAATEQLVEAKNAEIREINSSIADAQNQIIDLEHDIQAQQSLVAEMESIERRRAQEQESRRLAAEEASKKAAEEASKKAAGGSTGDTDTGNGQSGEGVTPIGAGNGKYQWPLSSQTYISSYFSYRDDPFGGSSTEFHNGIDIPAPTGTAVMAVAGGEVAWSYLSASAGNWIGIDHGNGTYSVYMHMSLRMVSEGDYVSAGQTIGLVGSTGRSTAPHLHLSIRLNGNYVDPLNYVSP